MRMKRLISVLLVTILTMSLFVGCAREELSFYKIHKELNELMLSKPLHSEGKVSFTVDALPQELLESDMEASEAEVMNQVISFVNENSFVYTMDTDANNNKTVAQFDLNSNTSDESIPLLTVIRNVDTTYVKLDDYFDAITNMVLSFGTEEDAAEFMAEMDELVGDIEYLSVSDEELITFYADMLSASMSSQVESDVLREQLLAQLDPEAKKEQSEVYFRFIDELLDEVYNNYSLDIVDKEDDDKYSMTFDADNLGNTVIGFLDYSLDNSETLVDVIRAYLLNLSDEEYSLLVGAYAVDMVNKKMLTDELDNMTLDFVENKAQYKEQLQQALVLYNSMYKAYIEGSKLQITLGETKDIFTRDVVFKIQVNDIENESVTFGATMTINETFKEIEPFDVEAPMEGVVAFAEFLERIPKTMEIYVDYDMYTMVNIGKGEFSDAGSMNIIIREGRSYLPTRMIAEKFGETIEWDNTIKKPYIVKEGINVYFDEFIIEDSVSYVKIREFEKFGYTINWDEDLRLITIQK